MDPDVSVREVMDREYVGVSESDDLLETVELLLREGADTAVVQRGSEPVGVVTCRDVLALLVDDRSPRQATVADAMTREFRTVSPGASLPAVVDELAARGPRRLVVTAEDGEPVGILTDHDVVATRVYDVDVEATPSVGQAPTTAETDITTALGDDEGTEAEAGYEDRSICEVCGTFSEDIAAFNGQLVCGDCRDM